jgi:hypothetical protein
VLRRWRATADHRPWQRATTIGLSATRFAQRPIACNAPDPYHLGDEPYPPKGASPEEVGHVNTHFAQFRIALAAAAALCIFLVVHAALAGVAHTADVVAVL